MASAVNRMLEAGDPTRHAELEALRTASQHGPLKGAVVYASGHPCPMCLCALVMNGISAVYYAFDNEDAAPFGFDSSAAYAALRLPLSPPPLPLIKLPSPIPAAALYGHSPMVKRPLPSGSSALLVLVVLIGINLRPFLTAIGPLAGR